MSQTTSSGFVMFSQLFRRGITLIILLLIGRMSNDLALNLPQGITDRYAINLGPNGLYFREYLAIIALLLGIDSFINILRFFKYTAKEFRAPSAVLEFALSMYSFGLSAAPIANWYSNTFVIPYIDKR